LGVSYYRQKLLALRKEISKGVSWEIGGLTVLLAANLDSTAS